MKKVIFALALLLLVVSCSPKPYVTQECMNFCNDLDESIATTLESGKPFEELIEQGRIDYAECRTDLSVQDVIDFMLEDEDVTAEDLPTKAQLDKCDNLEMYCDCKFKGGKYWYDYAKEISEKYN
ncbi:MAG: hypothetical protein ABH828_06350 [archaeon]